MSISRFDSELVFPNDGDDPILEYDQLHLLFYGSLTPSKYRFRPSFPLKRNSENWTCPAMVLFILRELLDTWKPLIQACLQHVETRVNTPHTSSFS